LLKALTAATKMAATATSVEAKIATKA